MNLVEAFKALNALNEDTFTVSDDGINKLSQFEQSDDLTDEISVIDPEAETEDDFQDSYVGKVILDCVVCHSKLYKDKEEVEIDEEEQLANVGEECPYCYTPDGFKIIGEVSAFETSKEDEKDDEEPEVKSDEDETDDKKEITESYKDTTSQMKTINEGIFGLGKKKKPDYYSKEEIAKRRKAREDKLQKAREDREEQERQRGAEIAQGWKGYDDRQKQAEKDYNRSRYNNIKGSNVSNTGKAGVHYSGGDYYTESIENDENLVESPVATLDRPMSKMVGTLGNVLTAHKDELFFMDNKQDTIDWLNKLEPEIKNKGYLAKVIENIEKLPDFKVQSYLYDIILKGDGMGSKLESKSIKEDKYTKGLVKRMKDLTKEEDPKAKKNKHYDKHLGKKLKALASESEINEDVSNNQAPEIKYSIEIDGDLYTDVSFDSKEKAQKWFKNWVKEYNKDNDSDYNEDDFEYYIYQDIDSVNKDKLIQYLANYFEDIYRYDYTYYKRFVPDILELLFDIYDLPDYSREDLEYDAYEWAYKMCDILEDKVESESDDEEDDFIDESKSINEDKYTKGLAKRMKDLTQEDPKTKKSKSNDKNLGKRLKALATEYDIDEDLLVRGPDGKLTTTSDNSWGTCKEWNYNESIKESVNTVNVETDDSIVTVDTQEDGKVTVSTEAKKEESNEEVITPISDETKTDIEDNVEEPIDSEETIDVELDEFDEESFDQIGESYLKEIYENVNKYKTNQVSIKKDKLVVEGVIDFTSGAKKKTSFIFESKDCTKQGKLRFTGKNKHITEDVTPFTLQGKLIENKFISESFEYNYKALNESADSAVIKGCISL